jgi:hypothetical protein
VKKSTLKNLELLAPQILRGEMPDYSSVTAQKTLTIILYLRAKPGLHKAAELGKLVGWSDRTVRQALAAIGVKGKKGQGFKILT